MPSSYGRAVAVLLSFLVLFVSSISFAYAQTTPIALQPTLVATVNIYSAAITQQSGNAFSISFTLSNREGAQPGIRYAAELLDPQQNVADEAVYPEILNLASNTQVEKNITYAAPAYLSGTYQLMLLSQNTNGLILAQAPLGSVTLSGTGQYVQIVPSACFVHVEGQSGEFTIDQGVDIKPTETLDLTCALQNNSSSDLSLNPSFETFARDVFGSQVETPAEQLQPVVVQAGATTTFTLPLPKPSSPQAYDSTLSFSDDTGVPANSVTVHFVLDGTSATLQNLILDKTAYEAGDVAQVSIYWSGPADSFLGARATSTVVSGMQATLQIANQSGQPCGPDVTAALDPREPVQTIPFQIDHSCVSPMVSARLMDGSGSVLASSTFEFTAGTSTNPQAEGGDGGAYVAAALAALALGAYLWWRLGGPRTPASTAALIFFVLVCVAYTCGPPQAHADTFTESSYLVTAPGATLWDTMTYTVNLDSSVYQPGATITASGSAVDSACGNSIYAGIEGKTAGTLLQVYGVKITGYDANWPYDPTYKTVWTYADLSAPNTPGNYNVHFYPQLIAVTGGTPNSEFCLPTGTAGTTGDNATCTDSDASPAVVGYPGQGVSNAMTSFTWTTPYNISYSVVPLPTATIASSLGSSMQLGQTTTLSATFTPGSGDSLTWDGITSGGSIMASGSSGNLSYNFTPSSTGTYTFNARAATADYSTRTTYNSINVTVTNPATPTCSVSISPDPSAYSNTGTPVTVSWSSSNASQVYINNIGLVDPSGSANVASQANTDYSCYGYSAAYGEGPWNSSSLTVDAPPAPTATITATPSSIETGQSSTISATSSPGSGDALTCTDISNYPSGTDGLVGQCTPFNKTYTFTPVAPGTYDFYAVAQTDYYTSWATYAETSVTVTSPPPACTESWSCSGQTIVQTNTDCSQTDLSTCVSPQFCESGSSECLAPAITPVLSGNYTGNLQIIPTIVQPSGTTKIYWDMANAQSCTVTGTNGDSWSGLASPPSGETSKAITSETIYTLSCTAYSPNPSVIQTQTVNVVPVYEEL